MDIEGYVSFYSATLNGIESTKRCLLLFDSLVVPATENAVGKQIEIFSGKYPYVKNYLSNHLIPLERLGSNYSDLVNEMMLYFRKYHYENWLNPQFEEEIGGFMTQVQAEISWIHSLRRDSILLSQIVAKDREVPNYWHDSEFSYLRNPTEPAQDVVCEATFNEIFDRVIPDPSCLDWNNLVDILEMPEFHSFREKLWSSMQTRTPLSEEYLETLEEFFRRNFPDDLEEAISLNVLEASAGLFIPVIGPAKSLYKIVNDIADHKEFSWISVVCKTKEKSEST